MEEAFIDFEICIPHFKIIDTNKQSLKKYINCNFPSNFYFTVQYNGCGHLTIINVQDTDEKKRKYSGNINGCLCCYPIYSTELYLSNILVELKTLLGNEFEAQLESCICIVLCAVVIMYLIVLTTFCNETWLLTNIL
ncbi:hypothetical protein ACTFIZ_004131 [Dictyostelium cf. discoideum]